MYHSITHRHALSVFFFINIIIIVCIIHYYYWYCNYCTILGHYFHSARSYTANSNKAFEGPDSNWSRQNNYGSEDKNWTSHIGPQKVGMQKKCGWPLLCIKLICTLDRKVTATLSEVYTSYRLIGFKPISIPELMKFIIFPSLFHSNLFDLTFQFKI